MKDKMEAVEEDRVWLETHLKQAKKSNKLLRAELDVRIQDTQATLAVHATMDGETAVDTCITRQVRY